MSEAKLFNIIGIFLFGGMALLVPLQLEETYKQVDAGLFIGIMGIIYFLAVLIYNKNKGIFVPFLAVLAFLAVGMIFLQSLLFGGHH